MIEDNFEQDNIEINNQEPQKYGNQNNDITLNNQRKILGPNEEVTITNFYKKSSNPLVALITVILKLSSIICFFLLSIFISNDALIMIIIILLGAADFWMTKNISGRILVGLRYWNEIKQDGSEVWVYENDNEKKKTSIDTKIFWGSIYLTPCFWFLLIPVEFFSFNIMNFLECVISFVLTFSNLYGYYKCSKEQNKKIRDYLGKQSQKGITNIISSMTNK